MSLGDISVSELRTGQELWSGVYARADEDARQADVFALYSVQLRPTRSVPARLTRARPEQKTWRIAVGASRYGTVRGRPRDASGRTVMNRAWRAASREGPLTS